MKNTNAARPIKIMVVIGCEVSWCPTTEYFFIREKCVAIFGRGFARKLSF
jgi:hypothetical protein